MTDLTARIAIDKPTHRLAVVLASPGVRFNGNEQIADLMRDLLNDAWEEAKIAGLVNESMLKAPAKVEKKAKGKK